MIITFHGQGDFKIKAKEGTILTGDKITINDFVISGPGEYEVAGISAEQIDGIFVFRAEEMTLTYLKRKNILNDQELEKVKDTDILFVPVSEIMEPKTALEVANQIEPRILIPMFYKSLSEFQKIEGISPKIMDQLKISKNLLPEEEREVVALNVQK